ncbi:vegetative incompatibility protein HET-E-1, putative, partial [Rhizoctonia solani AG-3 Rhs1AP]
MIPPLATRLDDASTGQYHSNAKEVSLRTLKTGPQDTGTLESTHTQVRVASPPQASESARVDMSLDSNDPAPAPAKQSKPQQTPRENLGASTRKDLKQIATGVAEQVADTLIIGPLRDVSDLLQSFADMYKASIIILTHSCLLVKLAGIDGRNRKERIRGATGPAAGIARSPGKPFGNKRFADDNVKDNRHTRLTGDKLDTTLSMRRLEDEKSKDRISSWVRLLPSSPSAWYNSSVGRGLKRRECTPGTRVDVLANLLAWTNSNSIDAVYWLNGMAGTGKTTIAYSVCKELDDKHKLAASFFCSRMREECRDVNRIIPSIAYQIAQFSLPFQSALSAILEKDQNAHHKVLTEQFEALIRKPLLALAMRLLSTDKLIVVIDALDECDDKDSTRDILDVLLGKTADLPIKFIVSSRPEAQVRDQMTDDRVKSKLVLHELDTGDVQADIETYLREELKPMDPSPTESQIAALVGKAGILFIYAATAVRYIGHDNFHRKPDARLCTLLGDQRTQRGKKLDEIDELYMIILEAAFGDRGSMRKNKGTWSNGLSELLQIKDIERVRAALRPLWSVLHVVGASELVTTLHASFPDFMFDSARSKAYRCDPDAHHRILAEHCFERIKTTQPQFNICGLESSYLPDNKVPNIEERMVNAISFGLLYACRYWADHVKAGKCALTLAMDLQDFLSTRLLIWMEVLNLNKQMKDGVQCMRLAVEWCSLESHEELVDLANDALRFVDIFASNPVSQSTPHIYVSMMTFWPKSAPIAKHYSQLTHGPVKAEGTALDQRQLAHLATWAFDNEIDDMAVSPDGQYIALGMHQDVLVLGSSSGQVVLGPLHGPSGHYVGSIIFSPDQTYILASFIHYALA